MEKNYATRVVESKKWNGLNRFNQIWYVIKYDADTSNLQQSDILDQASTLPGAITKHQRLNEHPEAWPITS